MSGVRFLRALVAGAACRQPAGASWARGGEAVVGLGRAVPVMGRALRSMAAAAAERGRSEPAADAGSEYARGGGDEARGPRPSEMHRVALQARLPEYKLVMKDLMKRKFSRQGMDLYNEMCLYGIIPDVSFLAFGMTLARSCNRIQDCLFYFDQHRRMGLQPQPVHFRILIGAYAQAGLYADAQAAFQQLKDRGFTPSRDDFHTVIRACAQGGKARSAMAYANEMKETYEMTYYTDTLILEALAKNTKKMWSKHGKTRKWGMEASGMEELVQDALEVYESGMARLPVLGDSATREQTSDHQKGSVLLSKTLMSVYCEAGMHDQVQALAGRLEEDIRGNISILAVQIRSHLLEARGYFRAELLGTHTRPPTSEAEEGDREGGESAGEEARGAGRTPVVRRFVSFRDHLAARKRVMEGTVNLQAWAEVDRLTEQMLENPVFVPTEVLEEVVDAAAFLTKHGFDRAPPDVSVLAAPLKLCRHLEESNAVLPLETSSIALTKASRLSPILSPHSLPDKLALANSMWDIFMRSRRVPFSEAIETYAKLLEKHAPEAAERIQQAKHFLSQAKDMEQGGRSKAKRPRA